MKLYSTESLFARSNNLQNLWKQASLPVTVLMLASGATQAQDQTPAVAGDEKVVEEGRPETTSEKLDSFYDKAWGAMELYKNPDNKVIQSLKFTGRFQADFAWVDDPQFDDIKVRRFRAGVKATLFQDWTVHAEADLSPEDGPFYNKLTDAYIAWSKTDSLEVALGKQSAPFTMDGSTSSKSLLAIDRSNVSNNLWFTQEYFPGVTLSGAPDNWRYLAGVYASGNDQDEFGHFDGSAFGLASLGYDFGENLGAKQAVLAVNYVYNGEDTGNQSTRQLGQVGSINFTYAREKCGVRADLSGGQGFLGQSDLWGAMVMPYYDITKRLQLVARYTYVTSDDPNGVRLGRYESSAVSGRGDEYNEGYLGLNYYFHGHKLKIQTGVQYAEMQDSANDGGAYEGWAWTAAFRLSW